MEKIVLDSLEVFQPLKMANKAKIKKCLPYSNQFQGTARKTCRR